MNLFDILKSLTTKKDLSKEEDFEKQYNSFMVNRYLSMNSNTVPHANIMNRYSSNIPKKQQYRFLQNTIPNKNIYFKYSKKNKLDKELLEAFDWASGYRLNESRIIEVIKTIQNQKDKELIINKILSDYKKIKKT